MSYANNKYKNISIYDVKNYLFSDYSLDNIDKKYFKIDKVGNELSGYYYFYEKINDKYKVYRANVQNKDLLNYLFQTDDCNNIIYYKDYVYYKDGTKIKYYNDKVGSKTVINYKELEFNKSLLFGLYVE